MDYKNTLNLPRTDFPMKADLVTREPQRLERWQSSRLYERILEQRKDAEKFVLHDGPPFTNGDVHIGNALNKILKDFVVKYHSLRGKNAPYVPGWDCHGLPIEFKVAQEMRKASGAGDSSASTDPAALRKACDAYARKYIAIQTRQFQRFGILGDWDNPYMTLAPQYEADELRLFADIVEKGFVYRGKKPVYWSIPCRTALAEAEVEYKDHVSQSVYVKFPIVGRSNTFILIWTTTPWTLPANLAVAFNPHHDHSFIRVKDETYLVENDLFDEVAAKLNWQGAENLETKVTETSELVQLEYYHPFCVRQGKLYPAEFVDNETGTGFVHIAPGHGLDDYNLGRSAGLPIYSPVDDDGRLAYMNDLPREQQMPAEMIGKSLIEKHGESEANNAVLHELRARNALVHHEHFHHSYPHCWRSKTPIIFRALDQWFVKIDHELEEWENEAKKRLSEKPETYHSEDLDVETGSLRWKALREIRDPNRITWIPGSSMNRISSAVESRPDWCISRQRSWGVPLPAFYDAEGNPILDAQIVRNAAALIEQHGSNIWFEKSAAELWGLLRPADWKGSEAASKSNDTLDVWIDSGSSSRAVTARRPELRGAADRSFQADMYLEGSDQHRGWFQSSLLLSLAGNGAPPYKTVLTHGFMVDADREKISKSKQGQAVYEKPQTAEFYVGKYGADILRLWVASQDFRNDVIVSEERINKVAESYRVIRNALRYQLSNLFDFDPAKHAVPDAELTGLDRWILSEFAKLEAEVSKAYDAYEFHVVYQRVSQFAAVELSAIYHDVVKDRLYTDAANSPRRRSTQTALHRLVTNLCQLLAPILAFTADEAWEFIPSRPAISVHLSVWEKMDFSLSTSEEKTWVTLHERRQSELVGLEAARKEKIIGKALDAKIVISGSTSFLDVEFKNRESLRELLNVSQLEIIAEPGVAHASQSIVTHADGQKCERCWHWEIDVGEEPAHPTICGRCVAAINSAVDRSM